MVFLIVHPGVFMKICCVFCCLFLVCCLYLPGSLQASDDYQITFQTNDCNGDTGLATVPVGSIYKIETITCDPPYEKNRRKQILLKAKITTVTSRGRDTFLGNNQSQPVVVDSYNVMTVNEDEAARIEKDINRYMQARRKLLENGSSITIGQ